MEYRKAIWIAYYELSEMTNGKDKYEFEKTIKEEFSKITSKGFNTVTVQVRPCADAFYKSAYFPTSRYFNGEQGSEMDYDPLEIICSYAQQFDLKIEAWINPYRVSQDDDYSKLSPNNFAVKNKKMTKVVDGKIYFNPAYDEVTNLIVSGVKELVENYNISAIHFDDYFYPTQNKNFDKKEYKRYGGDLSLADWRRQKVTDMVKCVYDAVKGANKDVEFGISPASNIENDKNNLYADVELWIKKGYVDYICPQVYFGFKNVYQPFMFTVKKWAKLCENTNVDLYIGLPLYKANTKDEYAAENDSSIINEFKNNNDIIARQITYISKIDKIKGYYIFSYSQLSSENAKDEVSNMYEVMQSNSQG
ncbi:family 10 glycosylhydrolase [Eubacterium coprostanoligenes]|uniref:glycoside hydrolase family 10 protein n=1 Tax=Eubacterium coprostanoligenes TaxID=290054 RepID=UPI002A816120|nr:family 10 glycosylhydrolase [Eubacterium coprostanoligenes]MDY4697966.1 family 10 glycosylhydrolase [Eubacterium coprostanoligenes]